MAEMEMAVVLGLDDKVGTFRHVSVIEVWNKPSINTLHWMKKT